MTDSVSTLIQPICNSINGLDHRIGMGAQSLFRLDPVRSDAGGAALMFGTGTRLLPPSSHPLSVQQITLATLLPFLKALNRAPASGLTVRIWIPEVSSAERMRRLRPGHGLCLRAILPKLMHVAFRIAPPSDLEAPLRTMVVSCTSFDELVNCCSTIPVTSMTAPAYDSSWLLA